MRHGYPAVIGDRPHHPGRDTFYLAALFAAVATPLIAVGVVRAVDGESGGFWNPTGMIAIGAFALLIAALFGAMYAREISRYRSERVDALEGRLDYIEAKLNRARDRVDGIDHRLTDARTEVARLRKEFDRARH